METARLFIAAEISDTQRTELGEILGNLKKGAQFTNAHPSWANAETLHLTIKFLGDTDRGKIGRIVEALERPFEEIKSFQLDLRGLGVFPDEKRPRVLWIGAGAGKEALIRTSDIVQSALEPLGIQREARRYHPHLTLARIRSDRGIEALMGVVRSHKNSRTSKSLVTGLALFESRLAPAGAIHARLHQWDFVPPAAGSAAPDEPSD